MIEPKIPGSHTRFQSKHVADYSKLFAILKKRRMTLGSFVRKAGISKCDYYLLRLGELMSINGEYQACAYLGCDTIDIRDLVLRNPPKEEEPPKEDDVEYHCFL
jgi:hypothetical protein